MTNDIDKKTLDGELQLDELKEAAGGRYLTGNELDGYFEIDTVTSRDIGDHLFLR